MFAVDDPNRIYFISSRPGGHIFTTTRSGPTGEWAAPTPVDIAFPDSTFPGWQFCLNRDGDIYFEGWIHDQPDLYVSRLVDGIYAQPERLSDRINTDYNEFSAYVEPVHQFQADRWYLVGAGQPGHWYQ
jgi:hypothetical protein